MKENKWSAFFKSMTSLRRRNGHEKFSNLNFISNIGRDESINPMKRNSTTWWASLRRTASKVGGRGDEDKGGVLFMALERCVVVMATTIEPGPFNGSRRHRWRQQRPRRRRRQRLDARDPPAWHGFIACLASSTWWHGRACPPPPFPSLHAGSVQV